MKYIIIVTTPDNSGNVKHKKTTVNAPDAKTAHATAEKALAKLFPDSIRVYPDTATAAGLARGALMVARRTAVNATRRGGNETQFRIEREFAAANARCVGAETAERILSVIADYSHDTQEFFGYAMQGLLDGVAAGLSIDEQYHGAFLTLNRYIQSTRAASEYETSTEFIIDGGGDIVAYRSAVACIIRGGDKWTPAPGGDMDRETAARLGAALSGAMRVLSPTQRDIVRDMAAGYSQRQIAARRGRSLSTVAQHIANIRVKVAAYIADNAPEFTEMATAAAVKVEETVTAATAKKTKTAEYYREYRARKKTENK